MQAVKAIQRCAGYPVVVQSTQKVTYLKAVGPELEALTRRVPASACFKDRCARAGPLCNAISITGNWPLVPDDNCNFTDACMHTPARGTS